ncbi:MAG: class I SAM-dependent methyltransferase [Candidatus Omnitrophota bacterium]
MKSKIIGTFQNICNTDVINEFAKTISGKKVLEIGCGGGKRTTLFKNTGCKVTGIDIIDTRKSDFSAGYDFIIADGINLPFRDEAFDVVVSFDVIEHLDRDELFLSEASRVCRKGGILVVGTPNRNRLSNRLRKLLGKKISYPLKLGKGCVHLREYSIDELVKLVKKVGCEVIKNNYVWFGLIGIGGFKRFPSFLNKWVQYLLLFARKL